MVQNIIKKGRFDISEQNTLLRYDVSFIIRLLPKQALQDFSVSLLLDSSLENVSSYLHRGILYTDLEK